MAAPNSLLPPRDRQEEDDRYNAGDQHAKEMVEPGYVSSGTDQLEAFANDPENASKKVQDAEEYAGPNFYRSSPGGKKQKITFKSLFKKKGPLTAILVVLLGGGGAFSLLLGPGIGIIQLKEVLVGDLNDQLAAVDTRTTAMWKTRLQSIQAGASVCSDLVQVRCKFSTVSKKQVERFRAAGFTVETETNALGRHKIIAGSFFTPDKVAIGNPQDLINWGQANTANSSSMNRVFNPIYASLSDAVSSKVFGKLKTDKSAKLAGTTTEELDKSMADSVSGDLDSDGNVRPMKDAEGREYLTDAEGNPVYNEGDDAAKYRELEEKIKSDNTRLGAASIDGAKATTGVLKGAIRGVNVLGTADSACTVYNLGRSVAAAAKVARGAQLAQYAMIFIGTADKIKAGDATPEEVAYIGNILTTTDTNDKVTDENSVANTATIEETRAAAESGAFERDNPDKGKNAFDSAGYSVAAHNDAPILSSRSQQYLVGGGLAGGLSDVLNTAANLLGGPGAARANCGAIQSWWARGIGLAAGVIAGIGTFGVGTALLVGSSVAVSMAIPFLEAMAADIIAGNVVGPGTKGVESGDAIFAGTAVLLGGMAMARGLKPLKKSQLSSYLAKTDEVQNKYVAIATYEASSTPFDINNQYSFLGAFARTVNIPLTKASSGVTGLASSIPALLSTSLASIIPKASAATAFNPERYNRCDDKSYEEIGIAADVFCNVRYGLSEEEMNLDPNGVLDYMLDNGHIDDTGKEKSPAYTAFLKNCVNREEGWGETGEEGADGWSTGANCVTGNGDADEQALSNFRIYTLDTTISAAMDDEAVAADTPDTTLATDKVALAKKIVAKGKVTYLGDVKPTLESIADGSIDPNAEPCGININILNIIDKITDKHTIKISDINRHCTTSVPGGSSTGSRHYAGNGSAIDIAVIDGVATRGRDAVALSVIDIAMPIMSLAATSTGSYSQLGQSNCGGGPALQPGIRNLEDFCNHLHLDVPAKSDPNLKYDASGW